MQPKKAFLVLKDGRVINKIVPTDEGVTKDDILATYIDVVEVREFDDENDPGFVNPQEAQNA